MKCRLTHIWAIIVLAGSLGIFTQRISAQNVLTPSNLEYLQDSRLQHTITLKETGISLSQLLKSLTRKELQLQNAQNISQMKLQICLKSRPVKQLMQSLAELLPGEWKPLTDNTGYKLEMKPNAVIRRERWWKYYQEEWDRARDHLKSALQKEMHRSLLGFDPFTKREESSDANIGQQIQDTQQFFRELSPDLQEKIAAAMSDFTLHTGYYTTGVNEGAVAVRFEELSSAAREILVREQSPAVTKGLPAQSSVYFHNYGFGVGVSVHLPDGSYYDSLHRLRLEGMPDECSPLPLNHVGLVEIVKRKGRDAPFNWQMLAEYQKKRVWDNKKVVLDQYHFPAIRRADTLEWLARKSDVEFVADYHTQPCRLMSNEERNSPVKRPLDEELNRMAMTTDSSWKSNEQKIYLVRNNRWYRDDYLEVPGDLTRKWLGQIRTQAAMNKAGSAISQERIKARIEWEADVVSNLHPWQAAYGLAYLCIREGEAESPAASKIPFRTGVEATLAQSGTFPFRAFAENVLKGWRTARFYASLTAEQKQQLWADQLMLSSLSLEQQKTVLSLAPEVGLLRDKENQKLSLTSLKIDAESALPGSYRTLFRLALTVAPK